MVKRIINKTVMVCILLGIVTVPALYAQGQPSDSTSTISGTVVDVEDRPVADIFVKAFEADNETFTDADGAFTIEVMSESDRLIIDERGYNLKVVPVVGGVLTQDKITLERDYRIEASNQVNLPYNTIRDDRSVSAVSSISGEELSTYPTGNVLEALAGRLPGVVVTPVSYVPGEEGVSVTVRGEGASVYVDGFERTADDLSADEVEMVQVFKDMSARTALGVSGAGPVVWITTRKGRPNSSEMNISTEFGLNTPTVLPEYLGSYDYARLYNEALVNDGNTEFYSQQALDAYRNNTDPAQYPNINYYNRYVEDFSSYRNVNINFSGVKDEVNYFGYMDYNGSSGLEKVGERINSDRFKLRGNVNFPINDWINMNVRVSGTYKQQKYPNMGGGSGIYNMFSNVLSVYPSNAHPITYQGNYMMSNDYPTNLTNELVYGGYGETATLNSQNDAEILLDLNQYINGLTFKGVASFNIFNAVGIGKGGTAALYRFAGDTLEQTVQRQVDPTTNIGNDVQTSITAATAQLNYDRTFGKHGITLDGVAFRAVQEGGAYQPEKLMDFSFRANYAFDRRYVAQLDLTYSGSMRLPDGERFNLYPSAGLAWIASNESFLENSSTINYLKFYGSVGMMGISDYSLAGFDPYYLYRTTWQQAGAWGSGVVGSTGSSPITLIQQEGNADIELPEKEYLNVGVQSRLFDDQLSAGFNYFQQKNTGLLSRQVFYTPAVVGGTGFLPAVNFEETKEWGVEAMLQFNSKVGDLRYSFGGNVLYRRGEYVTVDEPQALAEYQKRAGKDFDLLWGFQADGLYQSQDEIDNRNVSQSWGEVEPGDIRYVDYNGDGTVDQEDILSTGAHSPRIFYGVNLSLGYKGFGLFVQGNGVADGTVELSNPRLFKISGTQQNYSELMLNRWPETNEIPRLTTSSNNNMQSSTFWHRSAAYFRVSNVQLSYTLPKDFTRKISMTQLKVFVRGRNLFVTSELSDNYNVDPVNQFAGTMSYPLFRTVTAGISVKL